MTIKESDLSFILLTIVYKYIYLYLYVYNVFFVTRAPLLFLLKKFLVQTIWYLVKS